MTLSENICININMYSLNLKLFPSIIKKIFLEVLTCIKKLA